MLFAIFIIYYKLINQLVTIDLLFVSIYHKNFKLCLCLPLIWSILAKNIDIPPVLW